MLKANKRKWLTLVACIAAVLVVLIALSFFVPIYGEICSKNEYTGQEDCAAYHIILVALWHIAKAANDYGIAITALATVAVAAFTWTLYRATTEQGRLTKKSIKIADSQAAIAAAQTDILVQQKEITRQQFFAEHRPRLVLKDVFFASPDNFGKVIFELSNIGGSEAKITGGFIALNFITDARQFKRMTEGDLGATDGAVLKAGELRQFERETSHAVSFNLSFPDQRRIKIEGTVTAPPDAPLCFFGAILYVDGRGVEFGTERLSVFRRVWDQKSGGFRRSKNPDAEYAD